MARESTVYNSLFINVEVVGEISELARRTHDLKVLVVRKDTESQVLQIQYTSVLCTYLLILKRSFIFFFSTIVSILYARYDKSL